jgi:hypothetical protein
VQFAHVLVFRTSRKGSEIAAEADLDVPLREVVAVDQDFADLIGGIRILAFVGVVVLEQELAVAVLDDRLRVALDLVDDAEDLGDLDVERCLGAVKMLPLGWADSLRSSTSLA